MILNLLLTVCAKSTTNKLQSVPFVKMKVQMEWVRLPLLTVYEVEDNNNSLNESATFETSDVTNEVRESIDEQLRMEKESWGSSEG